MLFFKMKVGDDFFQSRFLTFMITANFLKISGTFFDLGFHVHSLLFDHGDFLRDQAGLFTFADLFFNFLLNPTKTPTPLTKINKTHSHS